MSGSITVNGKRHAVASAPDTPLLYVLRDEVGLDGPKFGCGLGQCSACMVMVGERAEHSCQVSVGRVDAPVTTIEGLGTPEHPHPLQAAFIEEQAAQCGYCTSGMIITAAALLAHTPKPHDGQIRAALEGNLCRCGCQARVLRAVKRAAGVPV